MCSSDLASENIVSQAVLDAQGSVLTNKYAEGYPGKRYYGGCEYVDIVEQLAIDRVKQLFGAEAANVQPHCGASANEAVFLAFLHHTYAMRDTGWSSSSPILEPHSHGVAWGPWWNLPGWRRS